MSDMTDAELVGYVDTHSRTDRALFHSDMLKRFFRIAGEPGGEDLQGWYALHYSDAKRALDAAYAALKKTP